MSEPALQFFCVAFIDGKTFKQKDALREFGCHWNGRTRIWIKKCDTEADAQDLRRFLDRLSLTARIVYPDGTQSTPPRRQQCPDAEKARHAVFVEFSGDIAFVRSFIQEEEAKRLANQLATRYPSNLVRIDITTEYRQTNTKWQELKSRMSAIQRSNFGKSIDAPQPRP